MDDNSFRPMVDCLGPQRARNRLKQIEEANYSLGHRARVAWADEEGKSAQVGISIQSTIVRSRFPCKDYV